MMGLFSLGTWQVLKIMFVLFNKMQDIDEDTQCFTTTGHTMFYDNSSRWILAFIVHYQKLTKKDKPSCIVNMLYQTCELCVLVIICECLGFDMSYNNILTSSINHIQILYVHMQRIKTLILIVLI